MFLVMLASKEMKKLIDWQEKELLNKSPDVLGLETVAVGKGQHHSDSLNCCNCFRVEL